ncbi:hypothetical protein ACN1C3_21800 [Pseudomonas sp. H11T01]|uniref:hypothetical protein n=1 Tax=Pseudomonas sp. H11T01 TaxID=3402749 RepID=UPI003ACB0624
MALQERGKPFFSSKMLACPLRGHWVSFRLVDEFGDGKPYGGLPYTLRDSVGQEYTGRLDGEGFVKLENHYRGPVVLTLDAAYRGVNDFYDALLKREHYPLPITELQVRAEQTRFFHDDGFRREHNPAIKDADVFTQVEVRDLVRHGAHLPPVVKRIYEPQWSLLRAMGELGFDTAQRREGRLPRMRRQLARALAISSLALAASGCAFAPAESFTLQAEVPADFRVKADAYYVPATGETCVAPPRKSGRVAPDRKFFTSEYQNVPRTAEFQIPLSTRAGGCPLVLSSLKLDLRGKWGPDRLDSDGDFASLSFRDELPAGLTAFPVSGTQAFEGQCQWLFRTAGPERYIIKILQCRAADAQGNRLKRMAGGVLPRDQLPGRTVRMVFRMAAEERPYMRDNWIRFPQGWKRCMGKSLEDQYAFCRGNTTDFKPFKMPDGRDCTVYPNCTE